MLANTEYRGKIFLADAASPASHEYACEPHTVDCGSSLAHSVMSFGPFRLLTAERLLKRGDESLPIGGRALEILIALAERAGEVITRKELTSRAWPDVIVEEANLRVHIAGLRKVLGDGPARARYIVNVPGRGYCFVAPVRRSMPCALSSVDAAAFDPPQRLPALLTRVVGREDTVRVLSEQLMKWRFVSIVGPVQ